MQLSLQFPYLSIKAFPTVTLPALTVIVGINGSGKSHLLQAIAGGQVRNSIAAADNGQGARPPGGATPQAQEIRLLVNDGGLGAAQPAQQYMSMQGQPMPGMPGGGFEHARATVTLDQRTRMAQATANRYESVLNGDDVWRIGPAALIERLGETDPDAIQHIEELYRIAEDRLIHGSVNGSAEQHGPQHPVLIPVRQVAERLGIPPLEVTAEHMEQFSPWGEADQFGANMALVFGRYRDALLANRLKQLEDQHNGSNTAFTEERFRELFGAPPWDQLNATIEAFGLPYEVAAPDTLKFTPVSINLLKKPAGEAVGTANLSSGEKVLFQFALSSFEYDEQLMNVKRPKLLLLDEMDASLHPEMVHRWLGAISNGLVEKQGIYCIITTHSPTTVALAPKTLFSK
ncbi:AAA family ATPase [Sphingomonas changnyeongensis]|uniref:AAA family ATPase n=1 Tax=Sphingomonas changnyeongensis TaxID=2698679 RepID=A0A7Z2NVW8_9SPHN|nr:AAA family ATPase [Sphingomonas changnyeongensis]QHL90798.1 AAA family ATPase [Sphingomonas changnyeongensis]